MQIGTKMKIHIPSYFGTDVKLVAKRTAFHDAQLKQIARLFPNAEVHVLAMGYIPEPQANVMVRTMDRVSPGVARNIFLREFYASDDDWCLFLDNDVLFDERYHSHKLYDLVESGGLNRYNMYLITASWPFQVAVNPVIYKHASLHRSNFVFNTALRLKTSAFFLKNFRKHGLKEYLFDESLLSHEDYELVRRLHCDGIWAWQCRSWVMEEKGQKHSTHMAHLFPGIDPEVARRNDPDLQRIDKQYGDLHHVPRTETVPRDHAWQFAYAVSQSKNRKNYDLIDSMIVPSDNMMASLFD